MTMWKKYVNTIRFLKPVQIYARLWFALIPPSVDTRPAPPMRKSPLIWTDVPVKPISMIGPNRFCFLNEEHEAAGPSAWTDSSLGSLWLFNLHYFDDLNAVDANSRCDQHRTLIHRWIAENPAPLGPGWNPYTISMRSVNWIKWSLRGNDLSSDARNSLATQIRLLYRRPEVHIQGNHLLANAKALIFAGRFFDSDESDLWLQKGTELFEMQLNEQILPDGGHYERSPMYQGILLEDLLDVVKLLEQEPRGPGNADMYLDHWRDLAARMLSWLSNMVHPDGQIALFNDAAFRISHSPLVLSQYGQNLGIGSVSDDRSVHVHLRESGYIRYYQEDLTAILDVGEIGPPHIPAHAHADTLSYELSSGGKRIVVDSGTSCYALNHDREYQRSTAAHNTVEIDGSDSSEVWGVFRVARRARPTGLQISEDSGSLTVRCAHDGYRRLPGRPQHLREFKLDADAITVTDSIEGKGRHVVKGFLHFHPCVQVRHNPDDPHSFDLLMDGFRFGLVQVAMWERVALEPSMYAPEFGIQQPNQKLVSLWTGIVPFQGIIKITFGMSPS